MHHDGQPLLLCGADQAENDNHALKSTFQIHHFTFMAFELLQETFKNPFVTVLLSAISPIGVAWLVKKWVTARLTGAINHEYNTRLEEHKKDMQADLKKQQLDIDGELKLQQRNLDVDLKRQQNELDAKLQSVRHQHEISQTRTSLFFEHQVKAFAKLLEQLAWTMRCGIEAGSVTKRCRVSSTTCGCAVPEKDRCPVRQNIHTSDWLAGCTKIHEPPAPSVRR